MSRPLLFLIYTLIFVGIGVLDCPLQIRDYCKFYCCNFYFIYKLSAILSLTVSLNSRSASPVGMV